MFKRKAKLPRGLPSRVVDSDTLWLVSNVERYSAHHRKISKRLKGKERANQNKSALDVIMVLAILLAFVPLVPLGYIKFVPTTLIAKAVSSKEAERIDNLRRSGCVDSYARHLFSPFLGGQVQKMWQYKDCENKLMNFPA